MEGWRERGEGRRKGREGVPGPEQKEMERDFECKGKWGGEVKAKERGCCDSRAGGSKGSPFQS